MISLYFKEESLSYEHITTNLSLSFYKTAYKLLVYKVISIISLWKPSLVVLKSILYIYSPDVCLLV